VPTKGRHDLEGEHAKRCSSLGSRVIGSSVPDACPDRTAASIGEAEIDDRVEQGLHALVLEGRAAQHRVEGAACTALRMSEASFSTVGSVPRDRRSIAASSCSTQASTSFVRYSAALSARSAGISATWNFGAQRLFLPDDRLHADEIDHALEVGLGTDRQLEETGLPRRGGSMIILHAR
jgi:hypothetical protein